MALNVSSKFLKDFVSESEVNSLVTSAKAALETVKLATAPEMTFSVG